MGGSTIRWASFYTFLGVVAAIGQKTTLTFEPNGEGLRLGGSDLVPTLRVDSSDWGGVIRTANDVAADFGRVLGKDGIVWLTNSTAKPSTSAVIIAGTVGKSSLIDDLVKASKIDVSGIQGKWESFTSQLVENPTADVKSALVIAGSDKRGTIFGLYDISEQIGVSPWYWWADVPSKKRTDIYAAPTRKTEGPPSVKYRGIFLNDESPALSNWARGYFKGGGATFQSPFYVRVFEVILRLRGNYLWPAMWDSKFYADDSKNGPLADYYGIVMGSSHTEPMARADKEKSTVSGSWDWKTNKKGVTDYMRQGAQRAKGWETIFTVGMRGVNDAASASMDAPALEDVIKTQQGILKDVVSTNLSSIPQMFSIYKEVGKHWEAGMNVPDDVTLLWSDDNVGNMFRLPLTSELSRKGGAGIYYHFDYVGDPRNYKWINTIQLTKTWEQMHLTYQRQANQIWIVNVGDLKPLELPIHHFMDMAYDMSKFSTPDSTTKWLKEWSAQQYGDKVAGKTAQIMSTYGKLILRRKYEFLNNRPFAYSVSNYDEAEYNLKEWSDLLVETQKVYDGLDAATQIPYFEMVLHPVLAGKTVLEIYTQASMNALYSQQKRQSTNQLASQVQTAYRADSSITARFHGLVNGKWNHMMDQVHLGYTNWQDPGSNSMPGVKWLSDLDGSDSIGVAVQGTTAPATTLTAPQLSPYTATNDVRYIDVFMRGNGTAAFTVKPSVPYVKVTPETGTLTAPGAKSDARVTITVDWASAPSGSSTASLVVSSGSETAATISLPLSNEAAPKDFKGFVEANGVVSIEPEHWTSNTSTETAHYVVIPDYGRTLSGVTIWPVTIPSQTTASGPKLTYNFYAFSQPRSAKLIVYLASSLNTDPKRPLKYAFSIDSGEPTTVQPVSKYALGSNPSGWSEAVIQGGWTVSTTVTVSPGAHVLNVWALEPGVVFQKLVIDLGGVKSSALGPPESMRV